MAVNRQEWKLRIPRRQRLTGMSMLWFGHLSLLWGNCRNIAVPRGKGTVGRPERVIPGDDTPLAELAQGLRALRRAAGQPPYRRLSAATHYSPAALARAAGGQILPSLEVTLAFAAACGGDAAEWRAAWSAAASWTRLEVGTPGTGALQAGRTVPAPRVGGGGGGAGPPPRR
jgi:hypothetical protein